jgi:hypothetical protein
MEERVFINRGNTYNEILRCYMSEGKPDRHYAYADREWGISFSWDHGGPWGGCERVILLESEVVDHAKSMGYDEYRLVSLDEVNVSVANSKFGTLDDISETIYRVECMAKLGSHSHSCHSIRSFIDGICGYNFFQETSIMSRGVLSTLLNIHEPKQEEGSKISLYLTAKDRKRERRTTMKAGRAFRHIFSSATDAAIAKVTEGYIEWSSPRTFSFHTGYKAKDFARAYDGDATDYRNPLTSLINKNLSTSCMQGVGRNYGGSYHSVGEAYASGDFHIAWLEDKEGRIAGRVVIGYVVEDDAFVSGPVYGSCEQSLVMLNEYLHDICATHSDCEGWNGLRLKVVGCPDDPIVPYIDGDYSGDVILGKYIKLDWPDHGSIGFENTDGYSSANRSCDGCGIAVHEAEAFHAPDTGETLCEYCFNESYVYTEDGDVISLEDSVQALMYSCWRNTKWSVTVHIDDAIYIESLDQLWVTEDVDWCNEREDYYPSHLLEAEKELAA